MQSLYVSRAYLSLPLLVLGCASDGGVHESSAEPLDTTASMTMTTGSYVTTGGYLTSEGTLHADTTGDGTTTSGGSTSSPLETDGSTSTTTTENGSAMHTSSGDSSSTGDEELNPCDATCLAGACADVVNVQTLGATGDGETDDYEALHSVAVYASAHPGVTLVFPEGTYRIARHIVTDGPGKNDVKNVIYEGLNDVHLVGCNAKIDLKGDFHRAADVMEGNFWRSYSHWVAPFLISDSVNFSIEGFEINGNVQLTTRDPGVAEGNGYGVFVRRSSDYTLRHLDIHHIGTDGILLGGDSFVADKNATVHDVACRNNARQGMSVIQVRGLTVTDSQFLDTGRTEGSYGPHSPGAGVDVEPNTAPPTVDVTTGEIVFEGCEFKRNLGAQFVAGHSNSTDDVLIQNSQFIASPDSSPLTVILAVKDGVIRSSVIDTLAGAVYPGYKAPPSSKTTLDDCTIYGTNAGVLSDNTYPTQIFIKNSRFIATHTQPSGSFMPYLRNSMCEFVNNEVFVPKEKFAGPVLHVTSLLENIALSSGNHFVTDLDPVNNRHFLVSYKATPVVEDHFDSGMAIRPAGVAMFDPNVPYSQP